MLMSLSRLLAQRDIPCKGFVKTHKFFLVPKSSQQKSAESKESTLLNGKYELDDRKD
jgi:hypothetical protein